MGYDQPVREALDSVDKLTGLFEADFDIDRGGFTWWHDYDLSDVALTGLMDYLYGLIVTVEENLRSAAIHLHDLRENRYSDDFALLKHIRETGRIPNFRMRTDREAQRDARIHAHEAGILRATGSILDTLAGVVVGVGGFNTNIMMAYLGSMQPIVTGADYPGPKVRKKLGLTDKALTPDDLQGNLLRATRSSLLVAGPQDWLEWTQFSRNDRVHRASRLHTSIMTADRKLARPMPRQPDHAETLAFRIANDVRKVHLTEDGVVTLEGILGSVNVAVTGVLVACAGLWCRRRSQPHLIPQPEQQWTSAKPPRVTTFSGYAPDTIIMQNDPALAVSPRTARRFQAAKVMDGDHPSTT